MGSDYTDRPVNAPFLTGLFDKYHDIGGTALDFKVELTEAIISNLRSLGERK